MPIKLAITVEVPLTFNETATIETISGSKEATSRSAEKKLSARRSIVYCIISKNRIWKLPAAP
jgi:hypothetical protein